MRLMHSKIIGQSLRLVTELSTGPTVLSMNASPQRLVGKEIDFSFRVSSEDDHFLEQIALSYEMAAIEGAG